MKFFPLVLQLLMYGPILPLELCGKMPQSPVSDLQEFLSQVVMLRQAKAIFNSSNVALYRSFLPSAST